ncbi:hypothetical protein Q7P37_010272 [Cladosporium fusiforme]
MVFSSTAIESLSQTYHERGDDGREQFFEQLYTRHHEGPRTRPKTLAKTLKDLLLSFDLLPARSDASTLEIEVIHEICWGMQRFCVAPPQGIDYAWDATMLFISQLKRLSVQPGQFDSHAFALNETRHWVAEFPSDDHGGFDNHTSSQVQDTDSSIFAITLSEWQENKAEQLANLSQNRDARRRCVVRKVIAGRALRDGYASKAARNTGFSGPCELCFIEWALRCSSSNRAASLDFQTSADAAAATFLLRAGAKSLLDRLPAAGCHFHELWGLEAVGAGKECKSNRLEDWKRALERLIIDEHVVGRGFGVAYYAGLALENLRDPRDETSEELFSWDRIVF